MQSICEPFTKKLIDKTNGKVLTKQGAQKNQNGLISVHKLSYIEMIKELDLLKKNCLCGLEHL